MRREKQVHNHVDVRIAGIGGGGSNVINRMIQEGLRGANFVSINTDAQAHSRSFAQTRIQVGSRVTDGLGTDGDWQKGARAAYESMREIRNALKGADLLFLVASLGGGTGSGAAPIVAEVAQDLGILTVGIVTRPFTFEGERPYRLAQESIHRLQSCVNSLIVLSNDCLLQLTDQQTSLSAALRKTDAILLQGTRVITDMIHNHGLINIDFADIHAILSFQGPSLMTFGQGHGTERAEIAAQQLLASPLLDRSLAGAQGILVNVTASPDVCGWEINKAVEMLQSLIAPEAKFSFGTQVEPRLQDEIRLTLIATGLPQSGQADRAGFEYRPLPDAPLRRRGKHLEAVMPSARPLEGTLASAKRNWFSLQDYSVPAFLQNR